MSDRSACGFTCTVLIGGVGVAQRLPDTLNILSWEFEETESGADKLKLSVDNFDLTNFDNPIFADGNVIQFSFGYAGNMSPQRSATISKVKGSLKLSVEALSKGILLNKIPRNRIFENMKRSDIAKQIATENGYAAGSYDIDDTGEVLPHFAQLRMTDGQLLRDMARREGMEHYVDSTGFHWHARRPGQKPVAKYTYYIDLTGTIKSFDIETDITARPTTVTTAGRDLNKKAPIMGSASNTGDSGRAGLAASVPPNAGTVDATTGLMTRDPAALTSNASGYVIKTTEKTQESAQRHATAVFAKAASAAVKLKATLVGDPNLCAKATCELAGLGQTLSGNYYVTKCTHKGGKDYDTVIESRRDGRSQQLPGMVSSAAKVNTADAPNANQAAASQLQPKVIVDKSTGAQITVYEDARGKSSGSGS